MKTISCFIAVLIGLVSTPVMAQIKVASINEGAGPKLLTNPNASPEARSVYDYVCSIHGKAMLAGQQESTWVNRNPDDEMDYIKRNTGKLPAIRGLDYIAYNGVTERAIAWWKLGGIPSICWHWGAPTKGTGYEASKLTIDVNAALTPGTALNKAMMADVDRTAVELAKLRDANVPVLWRPFHELNGGWFWWSKGGPEALKSLWKLMYKHYTDTHKLNNLIWVFGYTSKPDVRWYPGHAFVDIAGADSYAQGTQNRMFRSLVGIVGTNMPVCYHECGPIPDPAAMMADGTEWSWFLTWHTKHIKRQNSVQYINQVYNHPYVITLDELPDLRNRPEDDKK